MLITRETDYAIRILRALSDGERHSMKELCVSEIIPQQFAYKIIRKLSDAGYVRSVRGVGGGCELTADLARVSVYDLIRVTDPERIIAECVDRGYECLWKMGHNGCCSVNGHLCRLQRRFDEELKKLTIADLFKRTGAA